MPTRLINLLLLLTLAGCSTTAKLLPTTLPGGEQLDSVQAICYPPPDWKPEPLKSSPRHTHQIWISPTGQTAYGVAHFTLPLPVGADIVLWQFLNQMKQSEGSAKLIEKRDAPDLPGIRFEALGGLYRVRGSLTITGWQGWIAYAAERAGGETIESELKSAEQSRDATQPDQHH